MMTPTEWEKPVFLMNFPLSVSNTYANNALMNPRVQGKYDLPLALTQWTKFYHELAKDSVIYVLPGHDNLQDLPFVANVGCLLPHTKDTVLLSRFMSVPRRGEEAVALSFFQAFDYKIRQPLDCWEGEADLKWIKDNLYVGGIGQRSTRAAYKWMADNFEMEVIELNLVHPRLYHLDCVFFPLSECRAIVNVCALDPFEVQKLEKHMEVIPVPIEYMAEGWTNCIRLGRSIYHAPGMNKSFIPFGHLLERYGFELKVFDLTEFDKSGADLSCLVLHLNHNNRN